MDLENVSSINNTKFDNLLDLEGQRRAAAMVPVIVVVSVCAAVGLAGNLFVILFYSKKSAVTPTTRLIVAVAVIDAVVCLFVVPKKVVDSQYIIRYTNSTLCKLDAFSNYIIGISSVIVMFVIGIFRYRMICRPFRTQYTVRHAMIAITLSVCVAIIASIPVYPLFDSVPINITTDSGATVIGHHCHQTDDPNAQIYVLLMNAFHLLVFLVGISTSLVVLYGMIGRAMWNYARSKKALQPRGSSAGTSKHNESTLRTNRNASITVQECTTETDSGNQGDTLHHMTPSNKISRNQSNTSFENEGNLEVTFKITLMLFAIYVVFVVSFVPYASIMLYKFFHPSYDSVSVVGQLCYMSYVLNSVVNPFIYGFFNKGFSMFVRRVGRCLVCRS